MVDNKIASLYGYGHYLGLQQIDGSGVLGCEYIGEGTPADTSAVLTPTVDVCDENGYLIVHSNTSVDGESEDNTPSGFLEAGLAIAPLLLRQLFRTDDNDTQANASLPASASSQLSGREPAPLLIKRNSLDGVWGGKSWIIGALLGVGFVLFMLASCCFRYRKEENTTHDMEYNYRRHEEINQQAYAHQQREFDRLRRAELNQLHQHELDRSRWHREACGGPNHTHDGSADPPCAAELAYTRRHRSQSCRACRAIRATKTSSTDDSTLVDVDLQEPPQIYRAYTHTRQDDLPDHEDHWVDVQPVRYPVRRDSSLSSCSHHEMMKTGCNDGRRS